MSFRKVTHVIFDLDGLLIESESVYDRVIEKILNQFNENHTEELKLKLLGRTDRDTAIITIKEFNLPITPDEFQLLYSEISKNLFENPPLMPGAGELIQYFYDNNIPMAIATSSTQESMEFKTKHLKGLFKLLDHIVCGSTDIEVVHGKPAPDIFLVCARRFPDAPDPSSCLVFEDSPHGVQGALAAGMQAILVPADYVSEELRKPATVVLKSLRDFEPEWFSLPKKPF